MTDDCPREALHDLVTNYTENDRVLWVRAADHDAALQQVEQERDRLRTAILSSVDPVWHAADDDLAHVEAVARSAPPPPPEIP